MNETIQDEKAMTIFKSAEFGSITAIERNGEPWFVAKEISEILGYSATDKMTRRLDDDEKVTHPFRVSPSTVTQKTIISESGLYEAIFGSQMPKAKEFKRWVKHVVLPAIRKTGSYSTESPDNKVDSFELQLLGVKYAAEILRCSEISRLQMVHTVYEYNQVPTAALPVYIEKVRVTFSAKDLLEKNNCGISTIAFNKKMVAAGFLEEKTRTSNKGTGGVKKFKALTESGLQYGQNDASKHNPRETQPHYFEDIFMELFRLVNEN